jgi:adenosylcobyric acid synthase
MARAIMIQGTGSDVGKSVIVAGLARAFARQGLRVRPFKPQNMSNNAAVTADGGEIGRAQALQARAAGVPPSVHMNPVLLKPESETGAQVILQGRRAGNLLAADWMGRKPDLMPQVLESFARIAAGTDLVLVEGAGSPAEVNLRAGDIANMGFARAAQVPVVLLGDIDRGGVIAQLVGSHAVLAPADRAMIRGFAVNKFRGEPRLFEAGMAEIAGRTGWAPLGLVPWFPAAWKLPAEDAVDHTRRQSGAVKIAVPLLSRIANFDDLDPLRLEPGVSVEIIPPGRPLPGDARLVLIPGTKATLADLAFFRAQGWDVDLAAHRRRGGHILGLCGGYQMLGREVADPDGIEGPPGRAPGLGLLDIATILRPEKRLALRQGHELATGHPLSGYEIHIGESEGPDRSRGWIEITGAAPEGATTPDGRVRGSYLHGLFAADAFRRSYLERIGASAGGPDYEAEVDATLDALAEHLTRHMALDTLLSLAAPIGSTD